MEEIYSLLQERIDNVEEVKKKFQKSDTMPNTSAIEFDLSSAEASDLSQQISQAKRLEKLRIIKENELMEVIFSLRSFDLKQKLRFQAKSYEIMKQIRQDFNYEKYKHSGETKDIAKLYLNFFIYLRMDGKVNDLKRAYANNKFMGYPIISALMKWLVEVAREYFQNVLKEKSRDLVNSMSSKTKKTSIPIPNVNTAQKIMQSVNGSRPQSIGKTRVQLIPQIQPQSRIITDQSKKKITSEIFGEESGHFGNIQDFNGEFNKSSSPKSAECKTVLVSLAKSSKNTSKELPKFGRSQTNPKDSGLSDPIPFIDSLQANSQNARDGRTSMRMPELHKQNGSVVQIYVPVLNQNVNHLDIIEDLDSWQASMMIPQLFNLYKNIKKNKDSHLVSIDLDKKKELVNHVYKNIYNRNLDIERSVTNYQFKLSQSTRIDYEPINRPRKGESYCDTYSINFTRRFPHLVRQVASLPPSSCNLSKHQKNKSTKDSNPLGISLAQAQDTTINEHSALCIASPKNARSTSLKLNTQKELDSPIRNKDEDESNFNQFLNEAPDQEVNQNNSNCQDMANENPNRLTENEESYSKKKGNNGLVFGYRSEHHFRIVKKKANLFQEVKPAEDKPSQALVQKPAKLDHPINWGNSEENSAKNDMDNPSERTTASQTISSRREINGTFTKTNMIETSAFQKVSKAAMNPDKLRSWSTEKARPQNTYEDSKTGIQVRSSYRQPGDYSPLEYKEERASVGFEKVQVKAVYKSHLTSPKNDKDTGGDNNDLIGYKNVSSDNFLPNNPEFEFGDDIENKRAKQNLIKSKSPATIPRLYPKHTKDYSETATNEAQKVS